ncbi:O-methyltransferase [Quillaja saponaria]|uniref:O-methyltransferase n=1 Tax=Quillaja saponaria TaxID=32244 RepID=A0AAD7LKS9_QUISA|nr:O-methyltransferase [Quillaja saponaria]
MVQGQADVLQLIYNFIKSMALKCAVELKIADIINSHGHPIFLSQIAAQINPLSSIDIARLSRVMRFLVHKKLFTSTADKESGETLYGLSHSSKWLLQDDQTELSLAPLVLSVTHPCPLASWHFLSKSIREGGYGWDKVHGSRRQGIAVAEIVKSFPNIRGINFDLPHIVANAPEFPGVTHIGGDMFEVIPQADAVFMKWVLHNWGNEDCICILKTCLKAIPTRTGKVIIVDLVVQPEGVGLFDTVALRYDLSMMALTASGKERSEIEWKNLLKEGGFHRYKIIKIPVYFSIIEAYPI